MHHPELPAPVLDSVPHAHSQSAQLWRQTDGNQCLVTAPITHTRPSSYYLTSGFQRSFNNDTTPRGHRLQALVGTHGIKEDERRQRRALVLAASCSSTRAPLSSVSERQERTNPPKSEHRRLDFRFGIPPSTSQGGLGNYLLFHG